MKLSLVSSKPNMIIESYFYFYSILLLLNYPPYFDFIFPEIFVKLSLTNCIYGL